MITPELLEANHERMEEYKKRYQGLVVHKKVSLWQKHLKKVRQNLLFLYPESPFLNKAVNNQMRGIVNETN